MSDLSELSALLTELVAINSVNPDLIAGAAGEEAIAQAIAAWARHAGLEVIIQPVEPGRPNVIVIARGSGGGKTLMLNAHTDTVGIAGMSDPLSGHIDGHRLYGRGAYDMKASIAACLLAARRAKALGLRGDVIVTAVVDEEAASKGTEALLHELERWRPDAVIVTEPTEMELAVAHKGFAWFEVETFGVAAHGSRPQLGVDAIAHMGRVLSGLEQLDARLHSEPSHPYLGSGSVHAGLIEGGQELSSYPASCRLQLERRTLPGESIAVVQSQIQAILDECMRNDSSFQANLRPGLVRNAFEVAEDSFFVQLCQQQLSRITGQPARLSGVSFWADSALFAAAGLPTVLLGPTGFGAHGAVEWVDLHTVQQCVDLYLAVAQELCQ